MKKDIYEYSFDLTEQFIAVMDNNMCINKANKSLLDILDMEEKDIIGMPYWELSLWEDDFELQNKLMFAFENIYMGMEVKFEASYINANEEKRCIEFSIKAVKRDDEIDFLIAMGYDVTDVKRVYTDLNHLEHEMSVFFDSGADGYLINEVKQGIKIDKDNYDEAFLEACETSVVVKTNKALLDILEILFSYPYLFTLRLNIQHPIREDRCIIV